MVKRAFVAGYPIQHSLSPKIHNFWLKTYAIEGEYTAYQVSPVEFPCFINSLRERGLVGGNVTLPHKEQAFSLVQRCDALASQIGAVNSLWFEGDVLWGGNTDIYGFACNLDDFAPGWEGQCALVLGSGGAARAVVAALRMRGFKRIFLANRTRERAVSLAHHFGEGIDVIDWDCVTAHLAQAQIIVNTTSIGLDRAHVETNDSVPKTAAIAIDFSHARPETLVTDIVYTPLDTPFLQAAQAHGLKTVDGLGMLLHQAVPGFERWFGMRPQVTQKLRDHVLNQKFIL